jgi:short-subunit dehydrogenase
MFQHIIITGASNGLGMALAKKYAAQDICLGLVGRDQERLYTIANECENKGADVKTLVLDVRERETLMRWIEEFDRSHPLDLIIANAGINIAPYEDEYIEEHTHVEETFAVNLIGVIDTINPVLHNMASRGSGSVAIMSSLSGYRGIPSFPAYSASKAAIKSYYEAIRGLYRRKGVNITIICPSYIETDMTVRMKVPSYQMTSLDTAVNRIYRGIERRRPLVAFPWYHALGLRLTSLLPERVIDWLLPKYLGK